MTDTTNKRKSNPWYLHCKAVQARLGKPTEYNWADILMMASKTYTKKPRNPPAIVSWIDWVRVYAQLEGITYGNAMRDPECSKSYREFHGRPVKSVAEPVSVIEAVPEPEQPLTHSEPAAVMECAFTPGQNHEPVAVIHTVRIEPVTESDLVRKRGQRGIGRVINHDKVRTYKSVKTKITPIAVQ